jgi:hypothetical protein
MKCSVRTLSNGGISNGVVHGASRGLCAAARAGLAFALEAAAFLPLPAAFAAPFAARGLAFLLAIDRILLPILFPADLCRLFAAMSRLRPCRA